MNNNGKTILEYLENPYLGSYHSGKLFPMQGIFKGDSHYNSSPGKSDWSSSHAWEVDITPVRPVDDFIERYCINHEYYLKIHLRLPRNRERRKWIYDDDHIDFFWDYHEGVNDWDISIIARVVINGKTMVEEHYGNISMVVTN